MGMFFLLWGMERKSGDRRRGEMKPVRWIERIKTRVKTDHYHEQLIEQYGFEEYVKRKFWLEGRDYYILDGKLHKFSTEPVSLDSIMFTATNMEDYENKSLDDCFFDMAESAARGD
jgi:hypothetical protein